MQLYVKFVIYGCFVCREINLSGLYYVQSYNDCLEISSDSPHVHYVVEPTLRFVYVVYIPIKCVFPSHILCCRTSKLHYVCIFLLDLFCPVLSIKRVTCQSSY